MLSLISNHASKVLFLYVAFKHYFFVANLRWYLTEGVLQKGMDTVYMATRLGYADGALIVKLLKARAKQSIKSFWMDPHLICIREQAFALVFWWLTCTFVLWDGDAWTCFTVTPLNHSNWTYSPHFWRHCKSIQSHSWGWHVTSCLLACAFLLKKVNFKPKSTSSSVLESH